MDNQIFQIVEGIIVSFGGAAAIIGAIVKLCADTIAERLSRKYEIKLNKELESYKAQLDKKTYIRANPENRVKSPPHCTAVV